MLAALTFLFSFSPNPMSEHNSNWEVGLPTFPITDEVKRQEAPKTLPKLAFHDMLEDWKERSAAYAGSNGEEL